MTIDIEAMRAAAARNLNLTARPQRAQEAVPVVVERVSVTPVASAAYLVRADAQWSHEDFRDYVMGQIEKFHGPQVRNAVKETAIFKAFVGRWGIEQAAAIARYAFEVERGMWSRAPISASRFCAASDKYFAAVIAAKL